MGNPPDERIPPESHGSGITLDSALRSPGGEVDFGAMFEFQDSLPRLPIPALDESLNKVLRHLEPLQDHLGKALSQNIVLDFMKGDGPKLQQLLVEYEEKSVQSSQPGSYLEEFWKESFFSSERSNILNLNPFFMLRDSPDPDIAGDQTRRAASLCFASLKMVYEVVNETLAVDTFKGKALCMDQYKALFGASRVPNLDGSEDIDVYPESSHVLVLCRNQIYYFQALWPDGELAVDEEDICDILEALRRNAANADPVEAAATSLGVLTSLGRREWAKARQQLSSFPQNKKYLTIIDSALFVLVLDDYIPKSVHDAAANMYHGCYDVQPSDDGRSPIGYQTGSCYNRWYDKLQIIVCGDGTAGVSFESSSIDGHTALRFVNDIYAQTVVEFTRSVTNNVQGFRNIPDVLQAELQRSADCLDSQGRSGLDVFAKRLNFSLTPEVKQQIYFSETILGDQIAGSETLVLDFKDYGKLLIMGNNFSPDAFVQMSIMLAYYKIYGKVVCADEPVLTKTFYHGRTEGMRPATSESQKLCEIMCGSTSTTQQKLAALRRATDVHAQYVRECARGKGVDRHLFALKCIAERHDIPMPRFFLSEPWDLLNHTVLSTANCGNPSIRLYGFGPSVAGGFGIGYIIKDNSIHFTIISNKRQTKRYIYALEGMLKDMAKLFKRSKYSSTRRIALKKKPAFPRQEGGLGQRNEGNLGLRQEGGLRAGDMWGERTPTPPKEKTPPMDRWLDSRVDPLSHHAYQRTTSCPAVVLQDSVSAACWDYEVETNGHESMPKMTPAKVPDSPAPDGQNHVNATDSQPMVPMRRNSMFAGISRRQSLTTEQLNGSGVSLAPDGEEHGGNGPGLNIFENDQPRS